MKHKKKLIALTAACALLTYWLYPDQHPVYPASDHYDPQALKKMVSGCSHAI